jgi:hypothetical protein
MCRGEEALCASNADCCNPLQCNLQTGRCRQPVCGQEFAVCDPAYPCCSGLLCMNFLCLPDPSLGQCTGRVFGALCDSGYRCCAPFVCGPTYTCEYGPGGTGGSGGGPCNGPGRRVNDFGLPCCRGVDPAGFCT